MEKIRPNAVVKFSYGEDGRDCHYYIRYGCPNCNGKIHEKDIACTVCGTFFDWSRKASIKVTTTRTVVWEQK